MKNRLFLIIFVLVCLAETVTAADQGRVMVTSVAESMGTSPDALILEAVAQALSLKIRFRNSSFQRRLVMLEHGDVDLVCGLLKSTDREQYIHFVLPPYKTRADTIFIVPKGKAGRITSYEDLKGLKIGTTRGAKYFHQFDQDQTLIKEENLTDSNIRKLLLGRLDTAIQGESSSLAMLHLMGLADQVEFARFRFSQAKNVYFGISKRSWMMADLNRIESTIKRMILSGQIKTSITDYYLNQGLPAPAM